MVSPPRCWWHSTGDTKQQMTQFGITPHCPMSQDCPSTWRKSRWQGGGRCSCRKRDIIPLGSYFQLFRPLCPISSSSCPHLVRVAVGLWIFCTVRCPKTVATALAEAAAAEEAAAGQTDCSEEIFALVDGCQSWEQHHAPLLLHTGEKTGFGSKSSLSSLLQTHPDATQHPLTNRGEI